MPPITMFAPSPDARKHHNLLFQAWQCALGDARVTYLSGPITSGKRWVEAVEAGVSGDAIGQVISDNSEALLAAARTLRSTEGLSVLEPASLHVQHWSQDDYLALWTEVVEHRAGEVRFLADWPFSNGCAHEFERALQHEIPTLDVRGQRFTPDEGLRALLEACEILDVKMRSAPRLALLRNAIGKVTDRIQAKT